VGGVGNIQKLRKGSNMKKSIGMEKSTIRI